MYMYSITYHGNFLPGATTETQYTETSRIDVVGGDNYLTITGNNVGFKPVGYSYDSSVTFTLEPILRESTETVPTVTFLNMAATTISTISSTTALVGDLASVLGFDIYTRKNYSSVSNISTFITSRDVSISGNPSPIVFSTFSNLSGAWRIPNDETFTYSQTYTAICNLTQASTNLLVPYDERGTYRYYKTTTSTASEQFTTAFSNSYIATAHNSSINTNTQEYSIETRTFRDHGGNVAFTTIYNVIISNKYDYSISSIGIDTSGTFLNSSSSTKIAAQEYNYIYTRVPAAFINPTTTYTTTSIFISENGDVNSFNATVESSSRYARVLSMDNVGNFENITVDFTTETRSTVFFTTNTDSTLAYTYRFSNFNPMYDIESKTYEDKITTITSTSAMDIEIGSIASTASTVEATLLVYQTELKKTYNGWDYSYTESFSMISTNQVYVTSTLDVVTELNSYSNLITLTDAWIAHTYSTIVCYAGYSTYSRTSYEFTNSTTNSWKDIYTTSELGSTSIYSYNNSFTLYSTINISYTFSDDRINYSTTLLSTSVTSERLNNFNVYSTYSSYEISQTVDIYGNYAYLTTYFGTLEAGILDTTVTSASSWINIAAVSTDSFSRASMDDYGAGLYFNEYFYGSTSQFGIFRYNLTSITLSSSYRKNLNKPMITGQSGISLSSTSYSSLRKGVINSSFYTNMSSGTVYTKFTLKDYAISFWVEGNLTVSTILNGSSINSNAGINSESYSSTAYNTSDFGSTARLSSLVSSKNWVNVFNTYLADNYAYTYNVSSVWNYDSSITETLSEYSTALATSFKKTYETNWNYNSYSYTKSSGTNVLTTEDRFINRNGITNYSTVDVYITNTVAVYENSTMATMDSFTSSNANNTSRSISVIDYTFISDINDFTSSDSVIDTFTTSNVREQFVNSISTVISSTMEQQNDTLVFKSEIVTFSTYNTSATHSTISTLEINYEATTYTEEYNPISYTVSSTIQSTSLIAGTTLRSTSESVIHTQSIEYTPVYTTVDGIYMTTN